MQKGSFHILEVDWFRSHKLPLLKWPGFVLGNQYNMLACY